MRGETPGFPERAALVQSLYEILKKIVPLQIVHSGPKRFFEGSRLLFGLVLEKAQNMKISTTASETELPYVRMRIHDLRNLITMAPVLSESMQTSDGLVDPGFLEAFEKSGLLMWTNNNATQRMAISDRRWSRIATVSSGQKSQVLAFNADTVRLSSLYAHGEEINNIISPAEFLDLTYLANPCSRNGLSVAPPASLASASAPVLTLDRYGYLAVNVGRAACGEVGRDILIFRPTGSSEKEAVDMSIITQLLKPILSKRNADGTIVFEAYGDHHRKLTAPDEITMICVDLNRSMDDRCGFFDVKTAKIARLNCSGNFDPVQARTTRHQPRILNSSCLYRMS